MTVPDLRCPKCGALDVPNAKPYIEVVKQTASCNVCGKVWIVKP